MSKLTEFIEREQLELSKIRPRSWTREEQAYAVVLVEIVRLLLPAHDSEIREQAKAELFDQLYAAAGTEAMDAYRAAHPGPLTGADVVKAIREQAKREQMVTDCCSLVTHLENQTVPFNQWSRGKFDGLLESLEVICAAWAKAHPEEGDRG